MGKRMGSLRIVSVIALVGVAGIAAGVKWLPAGVAQERKAVATPAIRRVVTGHDAANVAKVIGDAPAPHSRRGASGSTSTLIWITDGAPADISAGEKIEDMSARILGTSPPPNGSRFAVIDYPPGKGGVMHRTETIDYVIVMQGEIDMDMDDSTVKLKAGDVMIQRGTNHAWVNRGQENALLMAVLVNSTRLVAKPLFRALFFVPVLIPGVAAAVIWQGVLNVHTGWLDLALAGLGVPAPDWLNDPQWVIPALSLISTWSVGNYMVIMLAGLQGVPSELYDAAKVDGANAVYRT